MNLQMLKKAMIAYVNSVKAIWSTVTHPLTIIGSRKCNLKDYKIYGNSIQNGIPTPQAQIEIKSVGELVTEGEYTGKYKIPVRARGKNLLNISAIQENYSLRPKGVNVSVDSNTQKVKVSGTANSNGGRLSYITKITLPAGTYYFSTNTDTYRFALTNIKSSSQIAWGNKFFTLTETTTLGLGVNLIKDTVYDLEAWVQIEEGQYPSGEYEPYIEPQNFNIYLDEPLRKVGDVADYIDSESQKVIRNTKQETITEIGTMSSSTTSYRRFTPQISEKPLKSGSSTTTKSIVISNKFKSTDVSYGDLGNYGGVIIPYISTAGVNMVAITFNSTSINTIEEAQETIGDGFDVCYILENPIEVDVDLPMIPQFKGTTIYEVLTDPPSSGIKVCYFE